MKPTKKRAAKRTDNPMVTKLLDLKYRINEAYQNGGSSYTNIGDKKWVMHQIDDVRGGIVLSKEIMLKCNEMWNKYNPSRLNNWEDSHSRRDDV